MPAPTQAQRDEARNLLGEVLDTRPGNPWPAVQSAIAQALADRDGTSAALRAEVARLAERLDTSEREATRLRNDALREAIGPRLPIGAEIGRRGSR